MEPTDPPRKRIPTWIPYTLLAVTSVGLVVPLVLLRRHRSNALRDSFMQGAAPIRTSGSAYAPRTAAVPTPAVVKPSPKLNIYGGDAEPLGPVVDDGFNGAAYSAKAFGLATLGVLTGAGALVLGTKVYLGVNNTREFADRMRIFLLTNMPILSSQIHRPPDVKDYQPVKQMYSTTVLPSSQPVSKPSTSEASTEKHWSWPEAETRLTGAYERSGFAGWAQAAIVEVQAEWRAEQQKRQTLEKRAKEEGAATPPTA